MRWKLRRTTGSARAFATTQAVRPIWIAA